MILKMLEDNGRLPGPPCSVRTILEKLEPDTAEELREALAGSYKTSDIVRVLQQLGHGISQGTLSRHRRNECSCFRNGAS